MEADVDIGEQVREAKFFSDLCNDPSTKIKGIVAKCVPESPHFVAEIENVQSNALKGIRRVLHTEPDELSQSNIFRQNVAALAKLGLSFDVCVTQRQLGIAFDLVYSCPEVVFILDHCGAPNVAEHESADSESWQQWQSGIHALAKLPNVSCKLSGICAYCTAEQRNIEHLRSYFYELLAAFGPNRIVWGSDWPVCNIADGLLPWSQISDQLLGELSIDEQTAIFYRNAIDIYKIQE